VISTVSSQRSAGVVLTPWSSNRKSSPFPVGVGDRDGSQLRSVWGSVTALRSVRAARVATSR
jgi:hypothetical protein